MARVFSGVQPTGNLHLGNYLGAIKNWVGMQDEHECLFCIVDMHAITVPQDPAELRANVRKVAALYVACGVNPNKAVIYAQSSVSGHAELAWILDCLTPLGWLNRMTQFKEKAGKNKENASLGLYGYPVLMAADILLYNAALVPVGEDQKQHLELARDIAGAFNRQYGTEFFTLPEPLIMRESARVMSLRDGTKKMSKSDVSDYSRINLIDTEEELALKIQKAKTDAFPGISYDEEKRPEISNLLGIYCALAGVSREEALDKFGAGQASEFKKALTEALVEILSPIRQEYEKLMKDSGYLERLLHEGAAQAREKAEGSLREIKRIVGF